jgi:hypothetical protein
VKEATWAIVANQELGLIYDVSRIVNRAVCEDSSLVPDLSGAHSLVAVSDYAGDHKTSRFTSVSVLVFSLESWQRWEDRRTVIRKARNIGTRRFEFKKLTDKRKLDALPAFLSAADQLDGLLCTVVFDKSIDTLFEQEKLGYSSAPLYPSFTEESLKRARLIVHFVSMIIAGVVRGHQNVTWISDEDEIAANAQRMSDLSTLWATVLHACVNCPLGNLKCGTTGVDNGAGDIEDLSRVPGSGVTEV